MHLHSRLKDLKIMGETSKKKNTLFRSDHPKAGKVLPVSQKKNLLLAVCLFVFGPICVLGIG